LRRARAEEPKSPIVVNSPIIFERDTGFEPATFSLGTADPDEE